MSRQIKANFMSEPHTMREEVDLGSFPSSQNEIQWWEMGWQMGLCVCGGGWTFNWISFSQPIARQFTTENTMVRCKYCHGDWSCTMLEALTGLVSLEISPLFSLSSANSLGLISVNLKICICSALGTLVFFSVKWVAMWTENRSRDTWCGASYYRFDGI